MPVGTLGVQGARPCPMATKGSGRSKLIREPKQIDAQLIWVGKANGRRIIGEFRKTLFAFRLV